MRKTIYHGSPDKMKKTAAYPLGKLDVTRIAGAGLGALGLGGLYGAWNPADPEHRMFSAQMRGLTAAPGASLGVYGALQQLKSMAAAGKNPGAIAKVLLPYIYGIAGGSVTSLAGRGIAGARYDANELVRKMNGEPSFEETIKRRNQIKAGILATLAVAGTAGLGYAGYKTYQRYKDKKEENKELENKEGSSIFTANVNEDIQMIKVAKAVEALQMVKKGQLGVVRALEKPLGALYTADAANSMAGGGYASPGGIAAGLAHKTRGATSTGYRLADLFHAGHKAVKTLSKNPAAKPATGIAGKILGPVWAADMAVDGANQFISDAKGNYSTDVMKNLASNADAAIAKTKWTKPFDDTTIGQAGNVGWNTARNAYHGAMNPMQNIIAANTTAAQTGNQARKNVAQSMNYANQTGQGITGGLKQTYRSATNTDQPIKKEHVQTALDKRRTANVQPMLNKATGWGNAPNPMQAMDPNRKKPIQQVAKPKPIVQTKQSSAEKQAIAPALALSLPFALLGGYGALKNTGKAIGNFSAGNTGQGFKDLGWAGVDALSAIPMFGMVAKPIAAGSKALRAAAIVGKALPGTDKALRATAILNKMTPAKRLAEWGAKTPQVSKWLGGDFTGRSLQLAKQTAGNTFGRLMDAIAKSERGVAAFMGRHMPGTTMAAGKGLDKLYRSPVFQNRLMQYFKKHPMQEIAVLFGADPVGNAVMGPRGKVPASLTPRQLRQLQYQMAHNALRRRGGR